MSELCTKEMITEVGDDFNLKLRWALIGVERSPHVSYIYSCAHNTAVGKTSLITRFMYDSFDNTYQVR